MILFLCVSLSHSIKVRLCEQMASMCTISCPYISNLYTFCVHLFLTMQLISFCVNAINLLGLFAVLWIIRLQILVHRLFHSVFYSFHSKEKYTLVFVLCASTSTQLSNKPAE